MIYLTGSAHYLAQMLSSQYLATLYSPKQGGKPDLGEVWAADNDCFSQGPDFKLETYLRWLEKLAPFQSRCLFAPAPDVVGDSDASLARSLPVLPLIRDLGYPVALVAQDGLSVRDVPWDTFDCLFIGGTTEWKLSQNAGILVKLAKGIGKWVHMGRVNSGRRFIQAYHWGCDSVDGNYLRYGPNTNFPRLKRWLRIHDQMSMSL